MAITRRTTMRKAFLGPWHPLVEQCWLYALADAQRQTGVAVHHSTLVLSHHHTDVTPCEENLPEFLRRFHRDLSCSLHELLAEEGYDGPRELFDDRPTHLMRLMDAEAQASHLVYERLNPVAAGLVCHPDPMPMRGIRFTDWKTGFIEVTRPPLSYFRRRLERQRLLVTPSPLLALQFDGDIERLVYYMNQLTEHGRRALRATKPRPPLGAKRLRRIHPWNEPLTMQESGGKPAPTFRWGARGLVGQQLNLASATEVHQWRERHGDVRIARRDGDTSMSYPLGTYAEARLDTQGHYGDSGPADRGV